MGSTEMKVEGHSSRLQLLSQDMAAIERTLSAEEDRLQLTDSLLKDIVSQNHQQLTAFQLQIEAQNDIVAKNEKEAAQIQAEIGRLEARSASLAAQSRAAQLAAERSRHQRIRLEEAVTRQRAPLLAAKSQLVNSIGALRQQLMEKNEQVLRLGNAGIPYACVFCYGYLPASQ
jgi:predicted  nucleic acid-binding Zn-ribbon protein